MQVPKRSDAHLRIAHSILQELFTRAFTQLDLQVCLFILRLSWGCGREWCQVPHLADFECMGVWRFDIHDILAALKANNVIYWNEATNHFAFNKMFNQWNMAKTRNAVKKAGKLQELIAIHASGGAPEPPRDFLEMLVNHQRPVGESPTLGEHNEVLEMVSFVGESPTIISGNVGESPTTAETKSIGAKENNKEREENPPPTTPYPPTPLVVVEKEDEKTILEPEPTKTWTPTSKNYGAVCTLYEQNIGMLGPIIAQELDEIATSYALTWIEAAMKEAVTMNRRHLKYIRAILDRWGVDGYKAPLPKKFEGLPGRPPVERLPTGDELEQAWKGRKGK